MCPVFIYCKGFKSPRCFLWEEWGGLMWKINF
jgi:hypothetical protein